MRSTERCNDEISYLMMNVKKDSITSNSLSTAGWAYYNYNRIIELTLNFRIKGVCMFKSANPALKENIFTPESRVQGQTMTINGTATKTALLLLLVLGSASWVWGGAAQSLMTWTLVGGIGGFICAMITIFKKEWVPVTAPIYAILQGLFLGALSSIFEAKYPGLVIQAVGLTFATLFCLLGAYRSGLIRASENFKLGLTAAMGGLMLFYLLSFILSFFGIHFSAVHGSGLFGIGFSMFVVAIAALNLVMDFDTIEQGAKEGAPKYMEWYGAFALLMTLVWLYVEILRLLSKLRDRER